MERFRLPPGQTLTKSFPVVGERFPPPGLTADNWELLIDGEVERPVRLALKDILELPQESFMTDLHCVTSWSQYDMTFTGVRLADLLGKCGLRPLSTARFVRFAAYSDRHHDTSLPLREALETCWLVHTVNGEPLTPSHGYPMRLLTPGRYLYKSLKWLHRLVFLKEDQLGFWERTSGYHNHGDPWKEERWEGARFTSKAEADAFRVREDYADQRDTVILKGNFAAWEPRTRNLSGLQLKASDFRGARLSGVSFRDANLTLGKFADADLEGVDFTGADLEGADFVGARLAGALFANNSLSATIFCREMPEGVALGLATHAGLRVKSPSGLLENQLAYLNSIGVLMTGE